MAVNFKRGVVMASGNTRSPRRELARIEEVAS